MTDAERMDRERRDWIRSLQRDWAEAGRVQDELTLTNRELRRHASLVIRCDDCAGRVVAHVTYIEGRPMLWAAEREGPGHRAWVDDQFWGDTAWCRVREYVLASADLLEFLPAPGAPALHSRVSHSGRIGQAV